MASYFSHNFFENNRAKLRRRLPTDKPIIITANGLLQRGGDSTYPFSQDACFWYLTGINEPDILLVMEENSEYLIVPERSDIRQTFDGEINSESLLRTSGLKEMYGNNRGWEKLGKLLKNKKQAFTVQAAPSYVDQQGFYTNPARRNLSQKLSNLIQNELHDVGQDIAYLRMVKEEPEIQAIQKAIDITGQSLKESTTKSKLKAFEYEFQMEAEIRAGFRRLGSNGDAFEPIIASGINACTLHNVNNVSQINTGELIIADVGAEVENFAADITRVYIKGKPTNRQKQIYEAVSEVQAYALSLLKPGTILREYEQAVETYMGKKLKSLKIIDELTHENIRRFYPHSTSHFLGLNVHDVGDYSAPLVEGIVITVEPGIYIKEEKIGVRIEDDVLITGSGNKVLSYNIDKKLG